MLKVEDVSKKLNKFQLQNISFELPKGYIMGLIGPNGAGKTTLLYMILGLYKPDEGKIEIDGNDILNHEVAAKNDMGYVLAEELFCQDITLIENADMYGKYYKEYDRELFLHYCQRFHLKKDQKLKKHSKGEKLKFQFAFALAHKPKLLILDEPTSNFDPEFQKDFIKIITEFVSDGEHSVVLATHLTWELDRIADYVTFLNHGNMVFSKDRQSLEDSFRLVCGEEYKINLLPEEKIIYKEKGSYFTKALVKHSKRVKYDEELEVNIPTLEDMMYFIVKGRGTC